MENSVVLKAERIVSDFLQEQVNTSFQIIGKGIMNQVVVVETKSHKVVVRMNDKETLAELDKEKWCIEQAAAAGIPGPEVLSTGIVDEYAFMIQVFVEGDNGLDSTVSKTDVWRTLGEYAKRIHSIPVKGYGRNLVDPVHGVFQSPSHAGSDGSWQGYVQYNIDCLTEQDPLIELGVITRAELQRVRELFEKLKREPFQFGLDHGDLTIKNVIVNQAQRIILLDWNAEVNVVPHVSVARLMQYQMLKIEECPSAEEFEAFMVGYGLSEEDLSVTRIFLLLSAFDNLRWAIDQNPDLIELYTTFAKQVIDAIMDQQNNG